MTQKRFTFAMSTQLFCEGLFSRVTACRMEKNHTCEFSLLPLILFKIPSFSVQFQLEEQFQLHAENKVFSTIQDIFYN